MVRILLCLFAFCVALSPVAMAADDYAAYLQEIDSSCQSDADCVVKDVHNCCGYYPACVNVNAAVDAERVEKYCGDQAMASICGFEEIGSCRCDHNTCIANSGSISVQ